MRPDDPALGHYPHGPDAPLAAAAEAAAQAESARALILVEGISDRIALETLAERQGRDLPGEGVVVYPIGGAQAAPKYLRQLTADRPDGVRSDRVRSDRVIVGLCDAAEEPFCRRALAEAGRGRVKDRAGLERHGFFVCEEDLEDELLRACGSELIEEVLAANGDLGSFRTMQKQAAWRDRTERDQLRRFLGAGARRKLRYARLFTSALDLNQVPQPLRAVLALV